MEDKPVKELSVKVKAQETVEHIADFKQ